MKNISIGIKSIKSRVGIIRRSILNDRSLIRRNLVLISTGITLIIALLGTIVLYNKATVENEVVITTIYFERTDNSDFKFSDGDIIITYNPESQDEIVLDFKIQRGMETSGEFSIVSNGSISNKFSLSKGIKSSNVDIDGRTVSWHKIDFEEEDNPVFFESWYCNLFEDRNGDVKFRLFLKDHDNLFVDSYMIPIYIKGVDGFNLDNTFPKPMVQNPYLLKYLYNLKSDEATEPGICLSGTNPKIMQKLQEQAFYYGVVIAILASLLGSLAIELIKRVTVNKKT